MPISARLDLERRRVLSVLCFFLALIAWTGVVPESLAGERAELLQLLHQEKFEELDARFEAYFNRYRAGEISDHHIEQAYHTFGSADPGLQSKLDAWIAARPDSASARMARAVYNAHLGWINRGTALARNTPEQRFEIMRNRFSAAWSDLSAVLALEPEHGNAYGLLIQISMALGGTESTDALARAGLQADPRSFVIRRRYLFSLTPWWRGYPQPAREATSLRERLHQWFEGGERDGVPDEIRTFVAQIEMDGQENSALSPLEGFVDYVRGALLARERRREQAVEYFDNARQFGDYWLYHHAQGQNFYYLGQYEDAVASFTRALEAWPEGPNALNWRARAYRRLGQLDKAFDDWETALSLDPSNPKILVRLAYALREVKRYEDVLTVLDRALVYGEYDDDVRDARGRILLYELGRPADAIEDLRWATELEPNSKRWYNYSLALYRIRDCKAAEALAIYRAVCAVGTTCSEKNLAWAGEAIAHLQDTRICPG